MAINVLAIVQARMSSTRLPGKVLKKIGDTPLISLLVGRLSKSLLTDQIIIACTNNSKDDALVDYLENEKMAPCPTLLRPPLHTRSNLDHQKTRGIVRPFPHESQLH